jgi:hypothetical protein
MELPLLVVLLTSGLGFVIIGLSNLVFWGIVQEVNAAGPDVERVGFWGAGIKFYRVLRRHRELFPGSKKRSKMAWLTIAGSLLVFGALISGILSTNAGLINN